MQSIKLRISIRRRISVSECSAYTIPGIGVRGYIGVTSAVGVCFRSRPQRVNHGKRICQCHNCKMLPESASVRMRSACQTRNQRQKVRRFRESRGVLYLIPESASKVLLYQNHNHCPNSESASGVRQFPSHSLFQTRISVQGVRQFPGICQLCTSESASKVASVSDGKSVCLIPSRRHIESASVSQMRSVSQLGNRIESASLSECNRCHLRVSVSSESVSECSLF